MCIKLLRRIQEKLACVPLKLKKSVQALQITVRSEWSVAFLCKRSSFKENHFLWKVHYAS